MGQSNIDNESRIVLIDALSRIRAGEMDYDGFELAVKKLPNSIEFDSAYNEMQHWFLDDKIRLKSAPYRQMQERLLSRLIDALRNADSKAVLEITLLSDRPSSPTNPLGPLWGHVALFVAVDAIAISFSAPDYEPPFFIFEPLYCAVLLSASASWQLLFKSRAFPASITRTAVAALILALRVQVNMALNLSPVATVWVPLFLSPVFFLVLSEPRPRRSK